METRLSLPELLNCCLFVPTRKVWRVMSGSMTRATFKKAQLDHLIDVILEAGNDLIMHRKSFQMVPICLH